MLEGNNAITHYQRTCSSSPKEICPQNWMILKSDLHKEKKNSPNNTGVKIQ